MSGWECLSLDIASLVCRALLLPFVCWLYVYIVRCIIHCIDFFFFFGGGGGDNNLSALWYKLFLCTISVILIMYSAVSSYIGVYRYVRVTTIIIIIKLQAQSKIQRSINRMEERGIEKDTAIDLLWKDREDRVTVYDTHTATFQKQHKGRISKTGGGSAYGVSCAPRCSFALSWTDWTHTYPECWNTLIFFSNLCTLTTI